MTVQLSSSLDDQVVQIEVDHYRNLSSMYQYLHLNPHIPVISHSEQLMQAHEQAHQFTLIVS